MSTEKKHTPGPWRVSGCMMGFHALVEHGDENERSPLIAEIMKDEGRLPMEANARLIAAAPELLDALKEIHKFWLCPEPKTLKAWAARCDVMADCARRAIAKAEGR